MRCLLIWPPRTSPSAIPGCLVACADLLGRRGHDVVVHDANLEFFLNHLALGWEAAGPSLPAAERSIAQSLRTEEFFQPERYLCAMAEGATALGSVLIGPAGSIPTQQPAVCGRFDGSRFAGFWSEQAGDWVRRANVDVVVLLATNPAQEQAAQAAIEVLGEHGSPRVCLAHDLEQIETLFPGQSAAQEVVPQAAEHLARKPYFAPHRVVSFEGAPASKMPNDLVAKLTDQLSPAGYVFGERIVGCDPDTWLRTGPLSAAGGVPASVSLPVGAGLSRKSLESAHDFGLRVIRWQWDDLPTADFESTLAAASALGIWNHLTVPVVRAEHSIAVFAMKNPNIVHSITTLPDHELWPFEPLSIQGTGRSGYEGLRLLPGDPFWRWLGDPAHLLLYVTELGHKHLAHLRVIGSPPAVQLSGSEVSYKFLPPRELGEGGMQEITSLVRSGGAVNDRWLRHNLERAYLIGVAEEFGVIVGCSTLKHPRQEYVERVREKCGLEISGYLERGYTSVRPEYRGLGVGTKLLEGLTSRAAGRSIYSVIREDDRATQTIAIRNRTRKVASFFSDRAGKDIGIWMPERQLGGNGGAE